MITGNSRRMQSWSRLDTWITDWRSCAMRLWCGLFNYFFWDCSFLTLCLFSISCPTYFGLREMSWADALASEGGLSLEWGIPAGVEHPLELLGKEFGHGLQHHSCCLCFDNLLEVKCPAQCAILWLCFCPRGIWARVHRGGFFLCRDNRVGVCKLIVKEELRGTETPCDSKFLFFIQKEKNGRGGGRSQEEGYRCCLSG